MSEQPISSQVDPTLDNDSNSQVSVLGVHRHCWAVQCRVDNARCYGLPGAKTLKLWSESNVVRSKVSARSWFAAPEWSARRSARGGGSEFQYPPPLNSVCKRLPPAPLKSANDSHLPNVKIYWIHPPPRVTIQFQEPCQLIDSFLTLDMNLKFSIQGVTFLVDNESVFNLCRLTHRMLNIQVSEVSNDENWGYCSGPLFWPADPITPNHVL